MKIDLFIFSKDRAAQLDLLLRSISKYADIFYPHILCRSSSPSYAQGYNKLMAKGLMDASWIAETKGPKDHLMEIADSAKSCSGLLGIATDDCVFYRKLNGSAEDIQELLELPSRLTVSLRLGFNTIVQDYQAGTRQSQLECMTLGQEWLAWDFRKYDWRQNYGYPFGMDFHIYRAGDVLKWTAPMEMRSFRDWEGALHLPQNRDRIGAERPLMVSPRQSVVVNVPINSVQVDACPAGVSHPIGLVEANERYLAGECLDEDSLEGIEIVGCHQEVAFKWKKQ